VEVNHNKQRKKVGCYEKEQDAAKAYRDAATALGKASRKKTPSRFRGEGATRTTPVISQCIIGVYVKWLGAAYKHCASAGLGEWW
jgi:hypothetical protein